MIDIDSLTLGQLKQIQNLIPNTCKDVIAPHPYIVGKNYAVRTVTMIFTGKLEAVYAQELVLVACSWIPDTGRWQEFIEKGIHNECEPYPLNAEVIVPRVGFGAIDIVIFEAALPRVQK
jgi:hypothetical protein